MKKYRWLLFLVLIKIIFLLWHNEWNWKKACYVNADELLIAEVAINYHKGLGYVSSQEIISKEKYNKTALRPSFPVFVHIFLMNLYQKFYPNQLIELSAQNSYFLFYGVLIQFLSLLLYAISLFSFYKIANFYFQGSERWSLITTLLFGIYPSILLYVGALSNYENIALPLIIIAFQQVLSSFVRNFTWKNTLLVVFAVILATLVRPQTFFVFFCMFAYWVLQAVFKKKYILNRLVFGGTVALCVLLSNFPALLKNKELFGKYIISTQAGFSFFEGHNPFARGSWCGDCGINPQRPVFQYVREQIKDFEDLNEFERSEKLKDLAWHWIKENPFKELVLNLRKLAIYFLPYNSDHNYLNFLNFIVHLGFLGFIALMIWKRNFTKENLFLLMPVIGSIAVSLIFFVGYRWRYYAEPFMIIACMLFLRNIFTSKIKNYANS